MSLVFEWDPHKAASNVKKHGIEFADAIAVFDDPLANLISEILKLAPIYHIFDHVFKKLKRD